MNVSDPNGMLNNDFKDKKKYKIWTNFYQVDRKEHKKKRETACCVQGNKNYAVPNSPDKFRPKSRWKVLEKQKNTQIIKLAPI